MTSRGPTYKNQVLEEVGGIPTVTATPISYVEENEYAHHHTEQQQVAPSSTKPTHMLSVDLGDSVNKKQDLADNKSTRCKWIYMALIGVVLVVAGTGIGIGLSHQGSKSPLTTEETESEITTTSFLRCSSTEQHEKTLASWYFGPENGGLGKWFECEVLCANDANCNTWMRRSSDNSCYLSKDAELQPVEVNSNCCLDHHAFIFNEEQCTTLETAKTTTPTPAPTQQAPSSLRPTSLAPTRTKNTPTQQPNTVLSPPLTCSEYEGAHLTCSGTTETAVNVEFERKGSCASSSSFWRDCDNEDNRNSCLESCSRVGAGTDGCCSYRAHLASGSNGIDGSTGKYGCLFYPGDGQSLVYNGNADIFGSICSASKEAPSPSPTQKPSTLKPTQSEYPLPPMRHVPNTYCEYYKTGGNERDCSQGDSFQDVWRQCVDDGTDQCMGVMWNSCTGATSDTSVPGAWKLITAGQDIGTADRPTATCGGRNQALGHWDVFARVQHIPNTYCQDYKSGGDGDCSVGRDFFDVWEECDSDGPDQCMGVMWNPCVSGPRSNTNVPGAWKLMKAGQVVGDANNPTATCGGKNQARGHWDVFIR